MAQLTIGDRTVTVDDSFKTLPPDQQHATVEEIARSIGVKGAGATGAPAKSPGMVEGLVRATAKGVPIVGGAANKLEAATGAGLAPYVEPLLPKGVGEERLPEPTFGERYEHALRLQEEQDTAFAEQHPIASTVAEIVGGISPFGIAARIPAAARALGLTQKALPGMIGAGAASGVALGGVDAAIRGENPVIGAGFGGAAGAAGPVVGKLAGEVAAPVARMVRGLRDPETEAARRVAGALDRDLRTGNAGVSPQEFMAAKEAGQPVGLMDIGGETTRALARSAANTSPEARGEIERFTSDRFGAQGDRLTGWFNSTFHYPNADATQDALKSAGRTVNRPAYAKAYSAGAHGIWDNSLEQMAQAPIVQDAIRKTMVSAKNEAAKMGFTPPKNPFVTDANGRLVLDAGEGGKRQAPSLQFWDYVKRNLDAVGTREAKEWSRVLREHLDGIIPEYADARAGAAKFFGAQDALEAGQKAVLSRMNNREIRAGLDKMSLVERKLFQDGFVDQYVRMLREASDRRNVLNSIANSPASRERIMIALGPQRAKELETFLRVEGIMDRARTNLGNSTTARQLVELGLAGGYNLYEGRGSISTDPTVLAKTAAIYGALRSGKHIDERVARHVAKLLTSSNFEDIEKGVKIVSRNKTLFKAIENADQGAGAIVTRGAVSGAHATAQDKRRE